MKLVPDADRTLSRLPLPRAGCLASWPPLEISSSVGEGCGLMSRARTINQPLWHDVPGPMANDQWPLQAILAQAFWQRMAGQGCASHAGPSSVHGTCLCSFRAFVRYRAVPRCIGGYTTWQRQNKRRRCRVGEVALTMPMRLPRDRDNAFHPVSAAVGRGARIAFVPNGTAARVVALRREIESKMASKASEDGAH